MRNKILIILLKCIGLFVALAIGPICIHILFKLDGPQWFVASWSAGEMLQYYGITVTAIITVWGLFLTFRDNRKEIREQSRLDKLPYFSLNDLNYKTRNNLMADDDERIIISESNKMSPNTILGNNYYAEEKITNVFLIIENSKVRIEKELDEKKKDLIFHGGIAQVKTGIGAFAYVPQNLIYHPFLLENVGNGAAINVCIKFGRLEEREEVLSVGAISVGKKIYMGLYSSPDDKENDGKYIMSITYSDIFNNKYVQKSEIEIIVGQNEIKTSIQIDFLQSGCI